MNNKEITLKDIISILWNNKLLIILTTIIVFTLTVVGSIVMRNSSTRVSTIVSLQWDGINDGKYPDGSNFVYSNVFAPSVITQALIDTNNSDLDNNTVRHEISMEPIIPTSVSASIKKAIESGQPYAYYATNYEMSLNYNALGLTVDEGSKLLNSIIETFRGEFERKYVQQSLIMDLTEVDFSDYEYVDIYKVLDSQMLLIENAMKVKVEDAVNFISSDLKIGFNDILIRCKFVRDIDLKQISTKIDTYSLSKDKDYLISKFNYEIKVAELDLTKAESKATDLQTLVDNYKGSTQTVLIPGMDPSQVIKIDTYYDGIVKELIKVQGEIAQLESEKTKLQLQLDRLNGLDPNFVITPEEQAAEAIKVDAKIESTNLTIKQIIEDANTILDEYNVLETSSIIKPLMTPEYQTNVSIVLNSVIGIVIGFGLGVVIALLRKRDFN